MFRIDRCVCRDVTFDELRTMARREGLGLAALMRRTGAGEGCGLCTPYLTLMLRTGQTSFHELLTEADVARLAGAAGDGRMSHSSRRATVTV
jgi:bacterioferritin-associated ferredoxin